MLLVVTSLIRLDRSKTFTFLYVFKIRSEASEQFAQIVECADYKMRNSSMIEWELWSDKYQEAIKGTNFTLIDSGSYGVYLSMYYN